MGGWVGNAEPQSKLQNATRQLGKRAGLQASLDIINDRMKEWRGYSTMNHAAYLIKRDIEIQLAKMDSKE